MIHSLNKDATKMCDHCGLYNYFPPVTIGGTSGDYSIVAPVGSNRYAEYQVVEIANGAQAATVVVSGDSTPVAPVFDGSKTISGDERINGHVFNLPASVTQQGDTTQWDRITHSQHKCFARIDNAASHSTYVTIRFRVRLLTVIPGPPKETHPDLGHQLNIERSQNIQDHIRIRKEEYHA